MLFAAIFNEINNYSDLLSSGGLNTFHFRYKMAAILKNCLKLLNTSFFEVKTSNSSFKDHNNYSL